eukprot:scaffold6.g2864.t1
MRTSPRASTASAALTPLLLAFNTLLLLLLLATSHTGPRVATQPAGSERGLPRRLIETADPDAIIAGLREQVDGLLKLRVEYGEAHCRTHGFGPTGGFCLPILTNASAGAEGIGGNDYLDATLCTQMAHLLRGQRVLDLGAGVGNYGRCLAAVNASIAWTGYDGSEGVERATDGYVKFMDLAMPQFLEERYDWVVSLEVGEHLPEKFEATFLGNIARHAQTGVLLSWAVPGQAGKRRRCRSGWCPPLRSACLLAFPGPPVACPFVFLCLPVFLTCVSLLGLSAPRSTPTTGHGHVNCRSNAYVMERMAERGFAYDNSTSQALRDAATYGWFKNIMAFQRN